MQQECRRQRLAPVHRCQLRPAIRSGPGGSAGQDRSARARPAGPGLVPGGHEPVLAPGKCHQKGVLRYRDSAVRVAGDERRGELLADDVRVETVAGSFKLGEELPDLRADLGGWSGYSCSGSLPGSSSDSFTSCLLSGERTRGVLVLEMPLPAASGQNRPNPASASSRTHA